jgi:signal peptidase I
VDLLPSLLAQAQSHGVADFINDLARTPLSQVVMFIGALSVLRVAMYPYLKNTPPHKRTGPYPALKFLNEIFDAFVYAGAFVFLIIRPFFLQTFRIPSGSMWPTLYVDDFIVANKAIYRYSDPKFGDIVVFRPPIEATQGHPEQVDKDGEVKVDFIKRLIGLPGDTIEVKEGVLYRNGQPVADRFKHYSQCTRSDAGTCQEFRELTGDESAREPKMSFKFVTYNGQMFPLNYYPTNRSAPWSESNGGIVNPPSSVADKYYIQDPAVAQELIAQPPAKIPTGYYFMMGDNRNGSFDGRAWGLVPRDAIIGRSEFIWLPISRWGITR